MCLSYGMSVCVCVHYVHVSARVCLTVCKCMSKYHIVTTHTMLTELYVFKYSICIYFLYDTCVFLVHTRSYFVIFFLVS